MEKINIEEILSGNKELLKDVSKQIFGKTPEEIAQEIQKNMPEDLKEFLNLKKEDDDFNENVENENCNECYEEIDKCEEYANDLQIENEILYEIIHKFVNLLKNSLNEEDLKNLEISILEDESIDNDTKVFMLRILKS